MRTGAGGRRSTRRRSRWSKPPAAGPDVEFDVVHVDDAVIVVDKPAGLVVHPGAGNRAGTLVNGLLARFPEIAGVGEPDRPGIVHRLDAGSSGLLVVARTAGRRPTRSSRSSPPTPPVAGTRRWCGGTRRRRTASSTRRSAAIRGDPLRMAVVVDGTAGPHRVRGRCVGSPRRPTWRCCRAGSRPGAPTRSACTSTGIGHPLVGDRTYGDRRTDPRPDPPVPPRRRAVVRPSGDAASGSRSTARCPPTSPSCCPRSNRPARRRRSPAARQP